MNRSCPSSASRSTLTITNEHNKQVVQLAQLHLAKKFRQEVELYDKYYEHILHFADMLASALKTCNSEETSNSSMAALGIVTVVGLLVFSRMRS